MDGAPCFSLEDISQEDIDAALMDVKLFVVGEVYGSCVQAGPPEYPYPHDRVYGVVIVDVDGEHVRYRYVTDRAITRGALRGVRPDSAIDAVVEADGPCLTDWTVRDEVRTSRLLRRGLDEFFVDTGEDERVPFCAA